MSAHYMDDDAHRVDRVDADAVKDHDFCDPDADEVEYADGERASRLRGFARAGRGDA